MADPRSIKITFDDISRKYDAKKKAELNADVDSSGLFRDLPETLFGEDLGARDSLTEDTSSNPPPVAALPVEPAPTFSFRPTNFGSSFGNPQKQQTAEEIQKAAMARILASGSGSGKSSMSTPTKPVTVEKPLDSKNDASSFDAISELLASANIDPTLQPEVAPKVTKLPEVTKKATLTPIMPIVPPQVAVANKKVEVKPNPAVVAAPSQAVKAEPVKRAELPAQARKLKTPTTNPFDALDEANFESEPAALPPKAVAAEKPVSALLPGEKKPEVSLLALDEIDTNDTLISDLKKLETLIAAQKRTLFPVKLAKALKQLHDEMNQVIVQRAYANMTDADEKAEFKALEKTYLAQRSKYKGTSGLEEGAHPYKNAKKEYVEACNAIKVMVLNPRLKPSFMDSQEYKDLRKVSQNLTTFLQSYISGFTNKKSNKKDYDVLADNLNMDLTNLQNFSLTLPGHYSWKKTLIGALLITAGLVTMAFAAVGIAASCGLLTLPALGAGFAGLNFATAGLAMTGAAGLGLFGGGVALTVNGARHGVAQAAKEFVDVAAKDIKDRLPRSARPNIKP